MQSQFARALCDAALPPPGLSARGFAVHCNNRMVALIEALEAGFPATRRIVGEEFFRAMAREFIRNHPPHSPVLLDYGDTLPQFIARFEPASSLPYLADVARIEAGWTRAYHAADAELPGAQILSSICENTRFTLHPAVSIVRSAHPAATIWQTNSENGTPGEIENWIGEDVLIARPHLDVSVHRLPQGGALFLQSLQSGRTLGEAAEAAFAEAPTFDLPQQLAALAYLVIAFEETPA